MNSTEEQEQVQDATCRSDEDESKAWRAVKICWTIIKSVIYIALVLFALGKMDGAFQVVVCSLLILILQSVNNANTVTNRMFVEESFVHRTLFGGILKRVGDPDCEEGFKQLRQRAAEYERTTVHWYINSAATYIVFLIVLWKIVSVVVL